MDERSAYAERIESVLQRVADTLQAIPQEAGDMRVVQSGSTPAIVAAHVHGALQAAAIGIACGEPVDRDRAAEFATADADFAQLAGQLRTLGARVRDALRALPAGALDERTTPPQHLMGAAPTRELARREAVVSALAHAAEHLGELQLMRDLLAEPSSS